MRLDDDDDEDMRRVVGQRRVKQQQRASLDDARADDDTMPGDADDAGGGSRRRRDDDDDDDDSRGDADDDARRRERRRPRRSRSRDDSDDDGRRESRRRRESRERGSVSEDDRRRRRRRSRDSRRRHRRSRSRDGRDDEEDDERARRRRRGWDDDDDRDEYDRDARRRDRRDARRRHRDDEYDEYDRDARRKDRRDRDEDGSRSRRRRSSRRGSRWDEGEPTDRTATTASTTTTTDRTTTTTDRTPVETNRGTMQTPQEIVKATQLNTQIEMMRALSAATKDAATKAIELAREKASELLGDAARPGASGSKPSDGAGDGGIVDAVETTTTTSEKGEKKPTYLIEFYDMDVKYEGLVIGPGGMTIRKLQQDIGTDIQVMRGEGKLQIKGSREKIDFAREQLDIFFEEKGSKTERVNCKARSGLVIGNAGQTIKALKEQTGCRIEVMRDVEEVVITGPGDRVKVAKKIIEKMIADSWVEGADGNVTIVEEVIPCAYKAGAIIGPNGLTIRNIRETTGVAIDIERGANGCKASDQCRVVGTAKQVKKAVDLVRQLLREMDRVELQAAPTVPPMYAYAYGNPYAAHAAAAAAATMNPYAGAAVGTTATAVPSQQMDPAAYAQWYAQYQQAAAAYGVHPNQSQQQPPPSGNAGDTTHHQG